MWVGSDKSVAFTKCLRWIWAYFFVNLCNLRNLRITDKATGDVRWVCYEPYEEYGSGLQELPE